MSSTTTNRTPDARARARARARAALALGAPAKPRPAAPKPKPTLGERISKGYDEFVTGTASAFLPPELDTTGGPLLRESDLPLPFRHQAKIAAAVPFYGRAARRVVEPEPLVDATKGGTVARVAKGVVNELPNLARGVGEQLVGQAALSRAGLPRPVAAALTGVATSMADTGVPFSLDTQGDKQRALQALYSGFANATGAKLGEVGEELASAAVKNKALRRVLPQLPFDVLSPFADVMTSGLDPAAIADPSHPEHEEALKQFVLGTVPSAVSYLGGGGRPEPRVKAPELAPLAEAAPPAAPDPQAPLIENVGTDLPDLLQPRLGRTQFPQDVPVPPVVRERVRPGFFPNELVDIAHQAGLENEPLVTGPDIRRMGLIEDPGRVELLPEAQDVAGEIAARRRGVELMSREEQLERLLSETDPIPDVRMPDPFALPSPRGRMRPLPKAPAPEAGIDWQSVKAEQEKAKNRARAEAFLAWRKTQQKEGVRAPKEVVQPEGKAGEVPEAGGKAAGGGAPGKPQALAPGREVAVRGMAGTYRVLDTLSDGRHIIEDADGNQTTIRPEQVTSKPAKPAKGLGFGGGSPRRGRRSGFVSLPSGQSVRQWVADALDAWDGVIEKAKAKVTDSPSRGIRSLSQVMPMRGGGTIYAELIHRRDGRRAAAAAARVAAERGLRPVYEAASKQQRAEIDALLDNPLFRPLTLTRQQLDAVAEARKLLAELQARVVKMDMESKRQGAPGLFGDDAVNKIRDTFGTYFRRFYRFHEDTGVPRRLRDRNPALWDAAVKEWLATDPTLRTPQRAALALESYLAEAEAELAGKSKNQQAGAGNELLMSPMLRRKLDNRPALRAILGEYTALPERFSKTYADLAEVENRALIMRDLANPNITDETGRPFSVSREEYLSGKYPEYKIQVPLTDAGIHSYADLGGRYVRQNTWEALTDLDGSPPLASAVSRFFKGTNKVFNFVNTALNPGTIGANAISGALWHSWLSDSFVLNPANRHYYREAIKLVKDRNNPKTKELFKAGAAAGMYLDEPLDTKGLLTFSEAIEGGFSPFEALRRVAEDFDKLPGMEQAARLYNGLDLMYRFASTLKRLDQNQKSGMKYDDALADAIRWTNKFHPDYSKVPTVLKRFQKTPLAGPFLSYFFDSPRVIYNGMRHNPVKFAAVLGAVTALEEGWLSLESDEEKAAKDAARELMTDFEQADFTPIAEVDGKLTYVPLGRLVPLAQFIAQVKNPKVGQFLLSSPAMNAVVTSITGKDVRGIQQIPEDATLMERVSLAAKMMGAAHVPPLTPGVGYEAKRIEDAIGGKPDRYGRVQTPGYSAMGLTGVRPRELDLDVGYRFRAMELSRGADDRIRRWRGIVESPRSSTDNIEEVIRELREKMPEYEARAKRLEEAYKLARRQYPKSVSGQRRKNVRAAEFSLKQSLEKGDDLLREAKRKLPANHPLRAESP